MVTGSLSRKAGGLFYSVRGLSRALVDAGHDVVVCGIRDEYFEIDRECWDGIRLCVLSRTSLFTSARGGGINRVIDNIDAEVVHQHGIWKPFSRVTAAQARSRPTVVSPRGMLDPWAMNQSRWRKRVAWHLWEGDNLKSASVVHALNGDERGSILKVLPHANVVVAPNALEVSKVPDRPKVQDCRKTALFLGRLHRKKGLESLIREWSGFPGSLRRQWQLSIAGPDEGGYEKYLRGLVSELGLDGDIFFIGEVVGSRKKAVLESASAFVLPSFSEGLPMAVLEAWALSVPVLMTRECNLEEAFSLGAAVEITADYEARTIEKGLQRHDLADIGRCGHRLVSRRYAWSSVLNAYTGMYSVARGLA